MAFKALFTPRGLASPLPRHQDTRLDCPSVSSVTFNTKVVVKKPNAANVGVLWGLQGQPMTASGGIRNPISFRCSLVTLGSLYLSPLWWPGHAPCPLEPSLAEHHSQLRGQLYCTIPVVKSQPFRSKRCLSHAFWRTQDILQLTNLKQHRSLSAASRKQGGKWKDFCASRQRLLLSFNPGRSGGGGELGHRDTGACEETVCLAKGLLDELP